MWRGAGQVGTVALSALLWCFDRTMLASWRSPYLSLKQMDGSREARNVQITTCPAFFSCHIFIPAAGVCRSRAHAKQGVGCLLPSTASRRASRSHVMPLVVTRPRRRVHKPPLGPSAKPKMTQTSFPVWLCEKQPVDNEPESLSTELEAETTELCLPLLLHHSQEGRKPVLRDAFGLPLLKREEHGMFCQHMLGALPAFMASLDASRPWLLYWSLNAMAILGAPVWQVAER